MQLETYLRIWIHFPRCLFLICFFRTRITRAMEWAKRTFLICYGFLTGITWPYHIVLENCKYQNIICLIYCIHIFSLTIYSLESEALTALELEELPPRIAWQPNRRTRISSLSYNKHAIAGEYSPVIVGIYCVYIWPITSARDRRTQKNSVMSWPESNLSRRRKNG